MGTKDKIPENFLFRAAVNFKLYIKHGFVYKLIRRVFCTQYRSSRLWMQLFKKETPTQVFFCEYCEILNISFLYRTPLVAAPVSSYHEKQLFRKTVQKNSYFKK